MGALVLDFLLLIIFLMMIPIGFYRGGLREMCVSAGLMLGILMAQSWASNWSDVAQRMFSMNEGPATFLTGIVIAFGITALVGYGGSAAFAYRPGPGGRIYGAYLSLFNALVAAGFLINLYAATIVPDSNEDPVTSGIIARSLSDGFGSVLLVATIGIGIATIFGMFVRERTEDVPSYQPPTQSLYQTPRETRPYAVQDDAPKAETIGPKRIREVHQWEEEAEPVRPDPSTYGSGWRQTWPDATPARQRSSRTAGRSQAPAPQPEETRRAPEGKNVLADWVKDQDDS